MRYPLPKAIPNSFFERENSGSPGETRPISYSRFPETKMVALHCLRIHVGRMAVGPAYPTPWCGWATWKDSKGVIRGMNCEGRTEAEARQRIEQKVACPRETSW